MSFVPSALSATAYTAWILPSHTTRGAITTAAFSSVARARASASATSHTRAVLSSPADASRLPSRLKARAFTPPVWPPADACP